MLARCTLKLNDIVVIESENGVCALLIHDPEIYPDGPPVDSKNLDDKEEEDNELKGKENPSQSKKKAAVCVVMGRFSDPVEAQGLAHCLVNLLLYPAEHAIYRDGMYKVCDEDLLKGFLDFFTPENIRFDVVSKSFTNSKVR